MSQRSDFLKFANSQVGVMDGDKVREWYNKNVVNIGSYKWPWCAAGISYCASMTNIDRNIISPTASSSVMMSNFKKLNCFKKSGEYIPRGGDIVIFKWINNDTSPANHVGIVDYVEGNYVHTIEFNSGTSADGAVAKWQYLLSSPTIVGYCVPKFKKVSVTISRKSFIRSKPWLDSVYKSSEVLKKLRKGDKVTFISDDGYGWSKIRLGQITGYIQNTRLNKKDISDYPFVRIAKTHKVTALHSNKKKLLRKNKKVVFICSIEKGRYRGKSVVRHKNKAYYISTSNLKGFTKRTK